MNLRIAVLPGDGIGPEVTRHAVQVLRAVADVAGYQFDFTECAIGGAAFQQFGYPLPQATVDKCLDSDAVLLGAVGGPAFDALPPHQRPEAGLLQLRQALGCFANLRPAIAYDTPPESSPLRPEIRRGADVLIVRELLGGLYFGEPRGTTEDGTAAYNTMRYTAHEVERVARIAFELASNRKHKLTSVDKANVLETSRLWRATVSRVAKEFPQVTLEHAYVDSFAMQLVTTPTRFDVVLTENLFGDVLSDEAAVVTGSLGLLPSASIGGAVALFEPIHGSAPDIAGRNIANPVGAIASAAMLLRYTAKLSHEADEIELAIREAIESGFCTADLARTRPARTTEEVGRRIAESVADRLARRFAYHAV